MIYTLEKSERQKHQPKTVPNPTNTVPNNVLFTYYSHYTLFLSLRLKSKTWSIPSCRETSRSRTGRDSRARIYRVGAASRDRPRPWRAVWRVRSRFGRPRWPRFGRRPLRRRSRRRRSRPGTRGSWPQRGSPKARSLWISESRPRANPPYRPRKTRALFPDTPQQFVS